jgi:predicted nucleotidyltransferase component of viral defense system
MDKNRFSGYQNEVLKALAGKIDDYYLAGGTALSVFYFQHRLSVDLDFFTQTFASGRVNGIIQLLRDSLGKRIKLAASVSGKGRAKMSVYNIYFTPQTALKVDFVEDVCPLIKRPRYVEGINILSLEDIYIRKLYALAGVVKTTDEAGREKFIGGRAEAKDFYDIYFLSHTFMPLSRFAQRYCDAAAKEALIRWFRTYDRMEMIDGILSLDAGDKSDYKIIDRHFKIEMDKLIERQLGEV